MSYVNCERRIDFLFANEEKSVRKIKNDLAIEV